MFGYPAPTAQDPHSIFSASSSGGWTGCAGFLEASAGMPDTAGEDAAYGTVCHAIVENALQFGLDGPDVPIGEPLHANAGGAEYTFIVDAEMLGYVEDCLNWIKDIPRGLSFVEERVTYDDLTPIPLQGGTCDLAVIPGNGTLYVRDWKFGKGVVVYATYPGYDELDPDRHQYLNSQMLLYAYGFFRQYDGEHRFERINIGVAQPRLDHWDVIEIGRDELLAFAAWVRQRAYAAWQPNAPRSPSPTTCRWCKGKATCDALIALDQRIVDSSFEDLTQAVAPAEMDRAVAQFRESGIPATIMCAGRMTTADLVAVLQYRKLFEERFEAVERELEYRADGGEDMTPHGLKLVEGRKNKVWNDGFDDTETSLRAIGLPYCDIIKYSLTTPAQAAEALKARSGCTKKQAEAVIAKLSNRPVGRPTLAPLADKRPALVAQVEDAFTDLTAEDL